MKKIISFIVLLSFSLAFTQVVVETKAIENKNANYFLGAPYYSNATSISLGKGLYFPRTDLTRFAFDIDKLFGVNGDIETGYDGMIVYNTVAGNVGSNATYNANTMGIQVPVKAGTFYYFENTTANDQSTNVSTGKWVAIGGQESVKAWILGGNETITQATIGANNVVSGDYIGPKDGNALIFATKGTVGSGSSATTGNIARLIIGGDGAGNIIKETTVGGTKQFDFALKVFGKARFTEGIVTSKSTYPDYVFDNYFTGKSEVNPSYQFMKLDEVEQFIKENNHLPGVTKIDDLSKDGDAYMVDVSETSIQTLEKVEELYLHVIEQQKQIKALKAEIAELKK